MVKRSPRVLPAVGGPFEGAPGWFRALFAAVESTFLSVITVVLPVYLAWLASPNAAVDGWRAIQVGTAGWCLGHGGGFYAKVGFVSVVPLFFTVFAVAICFWSAQRLTARMIRSEVVRIRHLGGLRWDVAFEGVLFVATYTMLGAFLASTAHAPGITVSIPRSALGFLLVSSFGYLGALLAQFRSAFPEIAPGWDLRRRLPPGLRIGVLTGVRSFLLLLGTAMAGVGLLAFIRFDRIAGLYDHLGPGLLGGALLTGLQMLYLPNFGVWALSWMAGPGFGIGLDSSITLTQSSPGPLPFVPVFAALPEAGALPGYLRVALFVPVVAGFLLERRISSRVPDDLVERALVAGIGVTTCALCAGVAAFLTGGSMGSAQLLDVGAPPFLLAAMLGGELAFGAGLSLGVHVLRRGRRHPEAELA
ncbi:cell division protein PerM [Austwickia chelonae]|uniref:Uncharacterized protein n=1 Tax=Austwickia chelonae NBRC 105200 TaxID=1184607 RepID=K6W4S5_9MICO|nr:DUF6350 family protein [Austwickia chelonae]GAB76817.1 hypothetical protein AUCHE_03_00340 [Austwickia chelonae NBRC 105200]